ncbi:hypothetical protein EIN_374270 [Entamoeba invadens IP1]|uniref:Uncharacterized protein n=1 Tax=Entamoeba invadens IP1 TaxID=370355 RepID=A0A0A1TU20_ENTIV|nr:hypothetical protein EIN_374270 [Entamoeba invadens IP1]ELP83412.1 hypothetical protein EIN_374270 [Entamoeba invadens IP1]|eukprot:XP_004182758.1 hypothetical protein EIN_374270 [Entamoeba invadens IP1]
MSFLKNLFKSTTPSTQKQDPPQKKSINVGIVSSQTRFDATCTDLFNDVDYVIYFPVKDISRELQTIFPSSIDTSYFSFLSRKELPEQNRIPLEVGITFSITLPLERNTFFFIPKILTPKQEDCYEFQKLFIPLTQNYSFPESTQQNALEESLNQYKSQVVERYNSVLQSLDDVINSPLKSCPLTLLLRYLETLTGFAITSESLNNILNNTSVLNENDLIHTMEIADLTINNIFYPGWLLSQMLLYGSLNVVHIFNDCALVCSWDTDLKCLVLTSKKVAFAEFSVVPQVGV